MLPNFKFGIFFSVDLTVLSELLRISFITVYDYIEINDLGSNINKKHNVLVYGVEVEDMDKRRQITRDVCDSPESHDFYLRQRYSTKGDGESICVESEYFGGQEAFVANMKYDTIDEKFIRHGVWKFYGEDGRSSIHQNYEMGCLHGDFKVYMEGELILQGSYKEGMLHGRWTQYDKFGVDYQYAVFEDGVVLEYKYYKD